MSDGDVTGSGGLMQNGDVAPTLGSAAFSPSSKSSYKKGQK